jgi:hypothetical protein
MKIEHIGNVKVFEIKDEEYNNVIHIYIPDLTDVSSVVCIMKNGEFLPFNFWSKYEEMLRLHLEYHHY